MSGNAEVIKEFLVSLGFKTDEAALKKFTTGIAFATGRVQFFVDAVEGIGKKVYESVNKFVDGMESLYYSSIRTGSSAQNLKAFDHAAEHLGVSAQEARASVEGLAKFMRDTPGSEGFIASLGVKTRDANGKLRDTTDILVDLGKKFKDMPWYHAQQYTNLLGIDDNTLRALRSGEFEAGYRKFQQKFANTGFSKAAEQARDFKNKIRDVGAEFEILGVQVQSALVEKLLPKLEQFIIYLQANGPQITAAIVRAIEILVAAAEKLGPILAWLFDWFMKIDAATDGWSTTILSIIAILKLLGVSVFGVGGAIAGLVANIGRLTVAMGGLLAKAMALSAAAYAGWEVGSEIYDKALAGTDAGDKIGEGIARVLAFFGNKNAQESIQMSERANSLRQGGVLGNAPVGGPNTTNASISQKTDIHVYAGNGGESVGQLVAGEQDRVNSRLVRNMKGAVR